MLKINIHNKILPTFLTRQTHMKPTSVLRHSTILALSAALGACGILSQPPAPVISGNGASSGHYYTPPNVITQTTTPTSTSTSNPYGAEPYTPNATAAAHTTPAATAAPYTPTASTSTTTTAATASTGPYIPSNAPVDPNALQHTVIRGDTVFNIAQRYRISQDDLRQWNGLSDNNIRVGQVLRVKPAGYTPPATAASTNTPAPNTITTTTTTTTTPAATANTTTATNPSTTATSGSSNTRTVAGITWQRPVTGQVVSAFSSSQKNVKFGGSAGDPVLSAADGKVVYVGSSLRGYGNLIIIQHNQTYLSAYGHNERILVQQGQTVRRGQSIATMGKTDAPRVQLHFEIRKDGVPMDPAQYLPN